MSHLSTSLPCEAATRSIPIVCTLHDYWLMCPRGQFMQMHPRDPENLWAACDGQDDRKCAERCYARYFGGAPDEREEDITYWTGWVGRRMRHVREMTELADCFIAPARYLLDRYRDEFGIQARKLIHLDYGFDLARLEGRARAPGEPFVFGYIGTHIPAKGIHDLIRAFGEVAGESLLRIWGRPRGQNTEALKALARDLPGGKAERVEWLHEYRNADIVREVFDRVDAMPDGGMQGIFGTASPSCSRTTGAPRTSTRAGSPSTEAGFSTSTYSTRAAPALATKTAGCTSTSRGASCTGGASRRWSRSTTDRRGSNASMAVSKSSTRQGLPSWSFARR